MPDHMAAIKDTLAALGMAAAATMDIQEELRGNLAVAAFALDATLVADHMAIASFGAWLAIVAGLAFGWDKPSKVIASFVAWLAIIVKLIAVGIPLAAAWATAQAIAQAAALAIDGTSLVVAWAAAWVAAQVTASLAEHQLIKLHITAGNIYP